MNLHKLICITFKEFILKCHYKLVDKIGNSILCFLLRYVYCHLSTVWKRIPKVTYVSLQTFKFGVFDAVDHFNICAKAAVLVFEKLGMIPGRYMTKSCA